MNVGDAITQAAREILERHTGREMEILGHGTVMICECCDESWPCPDRVAAERIVHAADALAATHEKIREHLTMASMGVAFVLASGDLATARVTAKKVQPELEAIRGLLSEKPTEHDARPEGS